MKNDILIIGGDHHNTLGIIESLALKGKKSYVITISDSNISYVIKSKYIIRGWHFNSFDAVLKCMINEFNDVHNKIIVISSEDAATSFLDKNADILRSKFILPISKDIGKMSQLMSKEYMTKLANKVGLITPKTIIIKNNKIDNIIEFPCITKAISSIEGSKDNIRICKTKFELETFLNATQHCHTIQIQKFIDKEYEFQLLGCSLYGGKEILIPGRTHIYRPKGIDNTFFLKFSKCEENLKDTIEKVRSFIIETGYSGLFSFEFLKGKDGKNYFTEMNFRNDGNAYCVTDAGINLPYIWYLSNAGLDYKSEIENIQNIRDSYIMPELYYTKRMFAGEVPFKEWFKNWSIATCYTTYFKQDKKPFFYFLFVSLIHLKNIILRKFKF